MPKASKYTLELLAPIVAESFSVSEVYRKAYGEITSPAATTILKNKLKALGIDMSHFLPNGNRKGIKRRSKLPDEILFSRQSVLTNATGTGGRNKRCMTRLIELGKPYICDECGIGDTWQGKPLRLQLEHIDGDRHNYEKSNLSFLCPNCHSQTKTHSGKNKKLIYGKETDVQDIN